MKKCLFISLITLLYSCSNETPVENELNQKKKDTLVEELPNIDTLTNDDTNMAVQENALTIEDFPKKWYKLDKSLYNENDYIINEYCEIQSTKLEIEFDNELGWRVLVSYPTDSQWYKIIDFDSYEEEKEGVIVMYGSFILENPDYPDMDVEIYDYAWNKNLKYATFGGFFDEGTRMVSELNKRHYKLIKEACD